MLYLSGFELHSRWVPFIFRLQSKDLFRVQFKMGSKQKQMAANKERGLSD